MLFLRVVVVLALAGAGGFYLLAPLGRAFVWLDWPVFNTWALTHGTGPIAWTVLSVIVFVVLWRLAPRWSSRR